MGLREWIFGAFSFLGTESGREKRMAQYVVREHKRGRALRDILQDSYVTNRCTPEQIERLLDHPEVLHQLGEQIVAETRDVRAGQTA